MTYQTEHPQQGHTTPQVCVTRCEGEVLAQCWHWPTPQTQVSLARVLVDLALQASDTQEMQHCMLELTAHPTLIALRQGSQRLRCSLNGQTVETGQLVLLQDGDVLEVGLCRFEIRPAHWRAQPQTQSQSEALSVDAWADLTQLAPDAMKTDAPPDALDDLLRNTQRADEWLAAERDAGRVSTVVQVDEPGQERPGPSAPYAEADAPQKLLQAWHALYLRRLESPQEAMAADGWAGVSTQQNHASSDVLDMLMQQAGDGPSLATLLGENAHISSVLAQLDAQGETDLLTPDAPVNVMHLFAPEGWQAPDTQGRVPLLNRQEHHGMALDSVLPMPVAKASSEHKD